MFIIQTIIEFIVVATLIYGLIHEESIAEWEQKQFTKIKERFTK